MKDYVYRRVVIEYGRLYAYVYWTDDSGKVLNDESFKQPYLLDRKDVAEEAKDMFDLCYQHLLDTVAPSASSDDEGGQSGEEDTP